MNNITSWMKQAKEVTRKISGMMYVPPEDVDEVEGTVECDNKSEDVMDEINSRKAANGDVMENKENISTNEPSMRSFEGGVVGNFPVRGFDRSTLEANAVATVEVAKKYANSFVSLAMEATVKAATTAEETARKLQNVVSEKTIIGNLDREQAKFNEEVNASKLVMGTLPWSDLPDSSIAKKQILSLSLDARNFTRDPPLETNFDFPRMQSVAASLLEEDPNLRKIRFQLVPKQVSEERFWRNYFYRVSLVRQSVLGAKGNSSSCLMEDSTFYLKNINQEKDVSSSAVEGNQEQKEKDNSDKVENYIKSSKKKQNDFEDRNRKTEDEKLKEIRKTVASTALKKSEEDWEKELMNDINDYELVNGQVDKTDEQWEEEIAELLKST